MRFSLVCIGLLAALFCFSSCEKENGTLLQESFIKQFSSDGDFASHGLLALDDGHFLLSGFDYRSESMTPRTFPRLIKLKASGEVVWDKRVTQSGTTFYKILPVSGTGFLTLGVADFGSKDLVLCLYNYEGDVISVKNIGINGENYRMSPFDMIRLSNGNFAIAGNDRWSGVGILKIIDQAFNDLYYHEFNPDSMHYQMVFRKLCETPDGSIALASNTDMYNPAYQIQSAIVRTDLNGVFKSMEILPDSGINITPYAITWHNDRLVVPSVTYSVDWQSGYGCEVNYDLHYGVFGLGSGKISIDQFSNEGVLLRRNEIRDYPRNGSIHSMQKTKDGGYICSGTVDQANSYYMLSDTKMYLLKLDANLNKQWSRTFYTSYQSYGIDAVQTPDGGYLLCGFHRSMDSRFQMLVIKTDANGNE